MTKAKPPKIPGLPNTPIRTKLGDPTAPRKALVETLERLHAAAEYYKIPDKTDWPVLTLMKLARDHVQGFQIEICDPLKIGSVGGPTDFNATDLLGLMGRIGELHEKDIVRIKKGATFDNESEAMRLIAKDPHFQKRAAEWRIDEDRLVARLHELWRKHLAPLLRGQFKGKNGAPSKYQKIFLKGVLPLIADRDN